MDIITQHLEEISARGFTVIENVYSAASMDAMAEAIEKTDTSGLSFRKGQDLFAIRRFLKQVPGVASFVFTKELATLIEKLFGPDYFLVKSIFFDKPEQSNWFVPYHQDLTISVDQKQDLPGFGPWTVKQDQFAVQPPLDILQSNYTIRIHLDDTDENNGALKVKPGSHLTGVYKQGNNTAVLETETVCRVPKGAIMIMRPLLLHASGRSIDHRRRRVIHLEFSNRKLPAPLQWSELDY